MTIKLITFLDGFSYGHLKDSWTPYFTTIANKGSINEVKTLFAFRGIGPNFLLGLEPKDTKIWTDYQFSSENSPYRWLPKNLLKMGDIIDQLILPERQRGWLRYGLSKLSKLIGYTNVPNSTTLIDLSILPDVMFSENFDVITHPSSFFQKSKIPFTLYNWPRSHSNVPAYFRGLKKLLDNMTAKPSDNNHFIFSKIPYPDSRGHVLGPTHPRFLNGLRTIDREFSKIKEKHGDDVEFLFFSDTGMSVIYKWYNLLPWIRKLRRKTDISYFVDSTMIRIKINRKDPRNLIDKFLSQNKYLIEVDDETLKEEKVWYNNFRVNYGDIILIVKEGGTFYPDFFRSNTKPHGMHGYLNPQQPTGNPVIFSEDSKFQLDKNKVTFTDVYNVLLKFINN